MAPEMRRDADRADAQLADVYSLAQTLWVVATGRRDPPLGELRRDRAERRLSTYVGDTRAKLLEPLLERSTSDDPAARPTMRAFADELSWWFNRPNVPVRADLSSYGEEAKRLREAHLTQEESEYDRLARMWNEAWVRFESNLTPVLNAGMQAAGLTSIASAPRTIAGFPPSNYGGTALLPCWGIDTIASPWLAATIGAAHRSEPATDLNDLAVMFALALMTPDSQHNYLQEFERFRSGSLRLDQIIEQLVEKIWATLPQVIADFLTACRETGVPR